MTLNGIFQIAVYLVVLLLLVKPLGSYMAHVFQGERTFLDPALKPVERLIYRLSGVDPTQEMNWKTYTIAMLLFSAAGLLFLYALQRFQGFLPRQVFSLALNPQGFGSVDPDLSFNTAASFTANTNWQNYAGETTLSYLTQMLGLTVKNFISAADGIAILTALIRGIARTPATGDKKDGLGNFWVDVTRCSLYILLPLAVVVAMVLVSQGVVQTLSPYQKAALLQPTSYQQPRLDSSGSPLKDASGSSITEIITVTQQVLAVGPAASQIAIKHLGTNGGGFFNANSAHPFENPTPLTDFIEILSETIIAAGLTYTFGKMVGDTRQGWAILAAMLLLLSVFMFGAYAAEAAPNPRLSALGVDQAVSSFNPGGNMEGKEVRFGITRSAIFATATTATSSGAVNSMHDSYMPLGGLVLLVLMHFGEVVLGGVGSGLYGILAFVIVAVFVAGLMVGRTPEYLGKKIEAFEMKMACIVLLIMPLIVLAFTALAVVSPAGKAGPLNPGPHGFSEILYAFTSMANNNGSAFAGLNGNTPFYNFTGAIAMLLGRFWTAVPILALAGSLVRKKKAPAGAGTLPTHEPLFIAWLTAIVIVVGALNFIPALALGPVVEHLMLFK
ncbi:MAG TPA: potassium-transporting ATPase subunit KdpA [Anaerolineales bacterium]